MSVGVIVGVADGDDAGVVVGVVVVVGVIDEVGVIV